jgi:hypothetical protein
MFDKYREWEVWKLMELYEFWCLNDVVMFKDGLWTCKLNGCVLGCRF